MSTLIPADYRAAELPLRYTIPEAASRLRVSRSYLYKQIKRRAIAVVKDGSRTYILPDELDRYVAAGGQLDLFSEGRRCCADFGLGWRRAGAS